jgi:hypothetical protein
MLGEWQINGGDLSDKGLHTSPIMRKKRKRKNIAVRSDFRVFLG